MTNYNKMYKEDHNSWGNDVAPMIPLCLKYIRRGKALDLGCGQGKEAFYLNQEGFTVTAVDSSSVAIDQINKHIFDENLKDIKAVENDLINFKYRENNYDLIICFNVLYRLNKLDAINVISNIKSSLRVGGIVAISVFSKNDTFFSKRKEHRFYVEENEIRNLFKSFEILEYFDGYINEDGHAGYQKPHIHGIVKIIAKKI